MKSLLVQWMGIPLRGLRGVVVVAAATAVSGCNCQTECERNPELPQCQGTPDVATLNILAPVEGSLLGLNDDSTAGAPFTLAEVTVEARDANDDPAAGVTISLTTNGGAAAQADTDASGVATFTDFELDTDDAADSVLNLIEAAAVGTTVTGAVAVLVDTAPPLCTVVQPKANATLTCSDDADGQLLNGLQTTVIVSTDAGDGTPVMLDAGGMTLSGTVTAGSASFVPSLTPGVAVVNTIGATCTDIAGNQGTGSIDVTVDCDVPVCTITGLVPDPPDETGAGCIDDTCYEVGCPAEANPTVSYTVSGMPPGAAVVIYNDSAPGGPVAVGVGTVGGGSAIINLSATTFVTGTDDLRCEATDPANGIVTVGTSFPIAVCTTTVDPAPIILQPTCPTTFFVSEDDNAVMLGFQQSFFVSVCCSDWWIDVLCADGTSGTYMQSRAATSCGIDTATDVTLGSDTTCDVTTNCLDDTDGTTITSATCTGYAVSSTPVLTISDPADGSVHGLADDDDTGTAGFQLDVTVGAVGLAGSEMVCLCDGPCSGGTMLAGPVMGGGTGTDTFNFTIDVTEGMYALTADECASAPTVTPDTNDVTIDLTAPSAPTSPSCSVTNARLGSVSCSWTVPADCATIDVRWGDDGILFDYALNYNVALLFPAGAAASTQMQSFNGPRIGNDLAVALTCVDPAGNASPPGTTMQLGALQPLSFERTFGVPGDGFGQNVRAGDLNCDGVLDLVVGVPAAPAGAFQGSVYIYFGPLDPSGLPTSAPDVVIDSDPSNAGASGAGIEVIPDFNGDASGCDDLAIASPLWSQVTILFGNSSGVFPAILTSSGGDVRISNPSLSLFFGYGPLAQSSLAAGDLDGDGLGDLLIGSAEETGTGALFVFLGSASWGSGSSATTAGADATVTAAAGANDYFASSVAFLGALTTGGSRAFAVGAPQYDAVLGFAGSGLGYAKVLTWSGGTPTTVFTVSASGGVGEHLGHGVGATGNFNGTGLTGVAIGSREGQGAVYVFTNDGAGLSGTVLDSSADALYDAPLAPTGYSVDYGTRIAAGNLLTGPLAGAPGSLDTDGLADVVMCTSTSDANRVFGHYGAFGIGSTPFSTSGYDFAFAGPSVPGSFEYCQSVEYIGDVNGDGLLDLAAGFSGAFAGTGAIKIYY